MDYLIFADPHLSTASPVYRKDDYLESAVLKIEHLIDWCEIHEATPICLGDVFHYKLPSRTAHSTVSRIVEVFRGFGRPVPCVIGNHDLQPSGMKTLKSQPIYTMMLAGVLSFESTDDYYLHHWGTDVDDYSDQELVFTHADTYDDAFTDYIRMWEDRNVYCLVNGHMHEKMRIVNRMMHVFHVPNLMRRSAAESDGPLALHVEMGRPLQYSWVYVPHKSVAVVFDMARKRRVKEDKESYEGFISNLQDFSFAHNMGTPSEILGPYESTVDEETFDFARVALEAVW